MVRIARTLLASLTLCVCSGIGVAADAPLNVGDEAPAFSLADQQQQAVSLEDLLAKNAVALVFYRSAAW